MRGGAPIESLAKYRGWALLSPRASVGVAHFIVEVDEELGRGERLSNIFARGIVTACGRTFDDPHIAHRPGNWTRCKRCERNAEIRSASPDPTRS